MKKVLMGLVLSFMTGMLYADPLDDHVKVRGIIHAWGEGEIHRIHAKLYLPPRGKGPLMIHLRDLKRHWSKDVFAEKFFVVKKNGRSIFYIVFPAKTDDKIVVMRGTYTRDASIALYAGDIFIGPKKGS